MPTSAWLTARQEPFGFGVLLREISTLTWEEPRIELATFLSTGSISSANLKSLYQFYHTCKEKLFDLLLSGMYLYVYTFNS